MELNLFSRYRRWRATNSEKTAVDAAIAEGAISALELKPGCKYVIFADRKAVPRDVLETLASALWTRYKIRTMVIITYGAPRDAVQVLEVES